MEKIDNTSARLRSSEKFVVLTSSEGRRMCCALASLHRSNFGARRAHLHNAEVESCLPAALFSQTNSVMNGKKFSVFVKSSLINYAHRDYAVHSERESFILYAVGEMKCPSEFCTASLKHHLE